MNLTLKQTAMPTQSVSEAITNFEEVDCGYTQELALLEADRCLQCKHQPCVHACPIHVPIPQFINQIKEGNLQEAYSIITSRNNFPDFCSRVCHVQHQCESTCVRKIKGEPVAINFLERYVADHCAHTPLSKNDPINKKVCVIGSGPSGLACASDLAQLGYQVSVYEKESLPGGTICYGVPKYRLPYKWIELEVEKLKNIGVNFTFNQTLGDNLSLDTLQKQYDSVYLAIGEEEAIKLDVSGNQLKNVFTSADYLKKVTTYDFDGIDQFKKVVVVGGGNTSMDCARSALRLGAKVVVSYRRREEDMPASDKEIADAKREGVKFEFLTSVTRIDGFEKVTGVDLVRRKVEENPKTHRSHTEVIYNSNFHLEADCIILALGSKPNHHLRTKLLNLEVDSKGVVLTNSHFETSQDNIFAGGDMVLGADTVVRAIDTGKKAALSIHDRLSK